MMIQLQISSLIFKLLTIALSKNFYLYLFAVWIKNLDALLQV